MKKFVFFISILFIIGCDNKQANNNNIENNMISTTITSYSFELPNNTFDDISETININKKETFIFNMNYNNSTNNTIIHTNILNDENNISLNNINLYNSINK